ncbi:GDP-mannose 4,6-dehydratase [Streptomyces sp. NPDC058417]|uniref:GDP-mannose 4,6-dehydratase n=1 Tax=unclassified Streptomyces TaxID=2593676 RepID=UPI00365061C9
MRVLVTGAAGFIGSRLCDHLRSAGDEVTEIDLPECDIVDTPHLTRVLKEHGPQRIYHLAAQANVARSWRNPADTWRTNAWGTLSLLRAIRSACPEALTIVMSSASVFDGARHDDRIGEERTPIALSPYGASKLAVEAASHHYAAAYGLQVTVVRPFNVIGPAQGAEYLVPSLARRIVSALRGGARQISVGSRDTFRDFVDVRDVARGLRLIMEEGRPGETYNLCRGTGVAVHAVAETMAALAGGSLELVQDPSLIRPADARQVVGDPAKTLAGTGWRVSVPLATTLADVLAERRWSSARWA